MQCYKIALVSDWFLPSVGGVEYQMRNLAWELMARGHSVEGITSAPGPDRVEGIPVHRLNIRRIPLVDITYEHKALPLLEEKFLAGKFDVIHCHGLYSPLSHVSVYLGKKHNIPTVLTNHSLAQGTPNDRLYVHFYHRIVQLWALLIYRKLVRRKTMTPDVITAVSKIVADETSLVYRTRDVYLLPDGIQPEEWRLSPQAHPRPRVTCVSRLYPTKRTVELIRAIPRIYEKLDGGSRPLFTIIGEGRERKRLENLVVRHGLEGDVELLGFQEQVKIREVFNKTDLFVLPSSREGFGIAVLEARTAGLPVVAMNHGGVGEIIRHGHDGYLADTYDEFVDHIAALMGDPALRRRVAENAKAPLPHFAWDQVLLRHLEVYRLAIEKCH